MEGATNAATNDSARVFNPADFSRETLAIVQRQAAALLESTLLLPDERACAELIVRRCANLLGKKRSARARIGNITEAEIEEWKTSHFGIRGLSLAARTVERIRNGGYYDTGGPVFPPDSPAFREVSRDTVESAMAILVERKVLRPSGDTWYIDEESEREIPAAVEMRRLRVA